MTTPARRIIVDGQVYTWRCGRQLVEVRLSGRVVARADAASVAGVDQRTRERGQWKRSDDGSVTPARVEALIEAPGSAR